MRASFVALALASASLIVFIACSADDPPAASSSGDAGDGGKQNPNDGPQDAKSDAPQAPDGCYLVSTGYKSGKKAENLPRTDITGAVNWTNVEDALEEDGKFATVTLNDGQESAELRVSQYGLDVPDDVDTWGIEVELKRRAQDGGVEDSKVDLVVPGKPTTFKFLEGPWPRLIVGTHHYGQAIDTWGIDLFPSDVNKPAFAAKLWVKKAPDAGPAPVVAYVESIKVAVWYCPIPKK
jgi:hypothetical protein